MAVVAGDFWPVEGEFDLRAAIDFDAAAGGAGLVKAVAFDID